jgi:transposase
MTSDLLARPDWLLAERITVVGMEATGACWKPVCYLLEHDIECWRRNAGHIKAVPGRKTGVRDAQWIAELVERGLVRPRFVPPEPIRQVRDLTRSRTEIVRERTRQVHRLAQLLEDAGIKRSVVVSDLTGRSARAMARRWSPGNATRWPSPGWPAARCGPRPTSCGWRWPAGSPPTTAT